MHPGWMYAAATSAIDFNSDFEFEGTYDPTPNTLVDKHISRGCIDVDRTKKIDGDRSPSMIIRCVRPRAKLTLLGIGYIVGGMSLFAYALLNLGNAATIALALAWFALFVALQHRLIRCSRCKWPLLFVRRGRAIIPIGWIPEQCSKCGAHTAEHRAG